ncbi:MAG: hypothetical protein ABIW81_08035 [Terrimesophilobacter sp.]
MTSFDFAGTTTLNREEAHDPADLRREMSGAQTLRRGISVVPLHDELWRVTRADGEVLGYVESYLEPSGHRYRAKRLIAARKQFRNFGEFWNFDDAVDCLRFG